MQIHTRCRPPKSVLVCLLVVALSLSLPGSASGSEPKDAKVPKAHALINALRAQRDPEERVTLIAQLAKTTSDRAAEVLATYARRDPDVRVRAAAATALGEIPTKAAKLALIQLVSFGGTRHVREALPAALTKQRLGTNLVAFLTLKRTRPVARRLAVAAMSGLRDEATRKALLGLASTPAKEPGLRAAAVRSFAGRQDAQDARLRLLVTLLARSRDKGVLLTALDVAAPLVHPVLRSPLKRLARHTDPDIASAAAYVLAVLAHRQSMDAAKKKKVAKKPPPAAKDDRYAKPPDGEPGSRETKRPVPDPVPPPPRTRLDIVWMIDATGSTSGHFEETKERILLRSELLRQTAQSVRLGVVVFRGGHSSLDIRAGTSVLPLTFDQEAFKAFLTALKPSGVDDRGTSIPHALHTALNQLGWRSNAIRQARLVADGGLERTDGALATVGMHFTSDKTKTFVTYVKRGRPVIPTELSELAAKGGTTKAEFVR